MLPQPSEPTQPPAGAAAPVAPAWPADGALTWPANDQEPVPGGGPDGTGHCPTCSCQQFDARASRMLDLVIALHEVMDTARRQVGAVRALLEEEVLP